MQPRGETDHYARNRKRRQNESTVFNAFPPNRPFRIKGKSRPVFFSHPGGEGEGGSSGWEQHGNGEGKAEGGPGLLGGLDLGRGVPRGAPGG